MLIVYVLLNGLGNHLAYFYFLITIQIYGKEIRQAEGKYANKRAICDKIFEAINDLIRSEIMG
ncbi:MAG TPA: hypothetical protein VGE24_07290 [Emticicia sp.]